ncbi:MAG: hypothetical protein ACRD0Q_07720 [Acidimicrobiales bacterium]
MRLARPNPKRGEAGQVASIEVLPFGVLTFVVATLLVANAWAVVDAKVAVSAAAREATRAYVEATPGADPSTLADDAARAAMAGFGRRPERLELVMLEGGFSRCRLVRFQASYRLPAVFLPWVGGAGRSYGQGFTASARHAEVVDPYRDGVPSPPGDPGSGSACSGV